MSGHGTPLTARPFGAAGAGVGSSPGLVWEIDRPPLRRPAAPAVVERRDRIGSGSA
jgi:hypothetical protein